LIGVFDPLFALSITGTHAIDSYSAATFLTLGAMVSSFIFIPIFMKKPLTPGEQPTSLTGSRERLQGIYGLCWVD